MAFYTTSSKFMIMNGESARQAATASCAYSTEMSRASMMNIALILDAILLASIIICALIPLAILVSVLAVALFVLVLVLLAAEYHHTPRSRRGA